MDVTDLSTHANQSISAVVVDYYRSIERQDFDAALSCFTHNAVYRRPGYEPFVGLQEISDFYHEARVISGGQHDLEAVIEQGDMVAVHGSFHGTSRSGDSIHVRFSDFWRFSELQVIERDTYFAVAAV
jgi:steroid Delta-isomerase